MKGGYIFGNVDQGFLVDMDFFTIFVELAHHMKLLGLESRQIIRAFVLLVQIISFAKVLG